MQASLTSMAAWEGANLRVGRQDMRGFLLLQQHRDTQHRHTYAVLDMTAETKKFHLLKQLNAVLITWGKQESSNIPAWRSSFPAWQKSCLF